jgi:hypothetical protein
LYFPDLELRIDQIEEPFQNTFKFIFDLHVLSGWIQEESGLFWINGKPGSGKSTLMKFIFRSEQTRKLTRHWKGGSYYIPAGFFHHRGTTLQKSLGGVLRSLITQILTPCHDAFRKQYQNAFGEFRVQKRKQRRYEQQRYGIQRNVSRITANAQKLELQMNVIVAQTESKLTELSPVQTELALVQADLTSMQEELTLVNPEYSRTKKNSRTPLEEANRL